MSDVFHLGLTRDRLHGATLAILPGDPGRVSMIAGHFGDSTHLASNREFTSYLGDADGVPIVVCSTGIGGPSTSIAVEELAQLGVRTFLRVGTTGAIQPDIAVADVIVTTGSVRLDGASLHFAPLEYPAVAHFDCVTALVHAARETGVTAHVGITVASDTFYPGQERYDTVSRYVRRAFQGSRDEWAALHVLNYEMESATLFTQCAANGWRAGMVAGVLVNRTQQEIPDPSVHARVESTAVDVVVGAARALVRVTSDQPVAPVPDTGGDDDIDLPVESVRPSTRKILIRALVMAIGIGVASALLVFAFDDLDLQAILDAIRSLTDAELLSLISTTGIVIWSEALLLATFVPGLPARRGAMAWLGPTAVSSVVPGPSDLPMIYRMFTSWGQSGRGAATSVAAASLLNIALKLVLPAIAGIGLAVADIPMHGFFSTIVTLTVILAVLLVIVGVVLGSERRTAAAGRALDRIWRVTLRLLRRQPPDRSLADRLVRQRAGSIALLGGVWKKSLAASVLVTATRVALFVMCIRFVGVPESAASWIAVFCVWAIVRGLTVVPIMPGGVGVSELAYVGLLTPIAGSQYVNEITAGVLLYRILTWLLMIPAGGVAIGLWRVGLRRHERAGAG